MLIHANYLRKPRTPVPVQTLLNLNIESDLWKNFDIDFTHLNAEKDSKQLLNRNVSLMLTDCCSYFEEALTFSSSARLQPYYLLARRILREAKTVLLAHKLIEERIDSKDISDHVEKLDNLIAKIYINYEKEDFSIPQKSNEIPAAKMEMAFKISPMSLKANSCHLTHGNLEIFFANFKFNIEKERAAMLFQESWSQRDCLKRFTQLTPSYDNSWSFRLHEAILGIESVSELQLIAKILIPLQVLELISYCLSEKQLNNKLPCLLVSLQYDVFQEVLQSLAKEKNVLASLNALFLQAAQNDNQLREWIETRFFSIRQTFVDTLNEATNAIDALSERFRKHMYTHKITKEDLQDIDDLLIHIKIKHEIIIALQTLFNGILTNPETLKVLKEIEEAYIENIARLAQTSPIGDKVKGRIYDIIDRNAFKAAGLENDDEAVDCFALWNLTTEESLKKSGLLGNLSDEEIEKLKLTEMNKIALKNLNALGLYYIEDIKRCRLYNYSLLVEFVHNKILLHKSVYG